MTLKDDAHRPLNHPGLPKPGEVYEHYKGGIYSIVCTSIKEDSLEPLVTYHSNLKNQNWTRTLTNFREMVPALIGSGMALRFRRIER